MLLHRGLLGTCVTIAKEEGASALWKGLEPGVPCTDRAMQPARLCDLPYTAVADIVRSRQHAAQRLSGPSLVVHTPCVPSGCGMQVFTDKWCMAACALACTSQ
jgi:hypothetical protein